MNAKQVRIVEELRDLVSGEILVDELSRAAYGCDASILEIRPTVVVVPRTVEEIADVVRFCAENGLSVHPRGAGTGLAGESLGPGVMIDTSRNLRSILETTETTVRVQPGVRWSELQEHLARFGRMFPPDPFSGDRCTIGGMLATDATGPHSLRYGATRDYVQSLRVVLADGRIVTFDHNALATAQRDDDEEFDRIVQEVRATLVEHEEDIRSEQPAHGFKPGGYDLRGVLRNGQLDMARMLVGSEGTLAVFAEAELATLPAPRYRGLLVAGFRTLDAAASAVAESLEYQPTACEMLDRRLIAVTRPAHPLYRLWIPEDAEAILLLEQEGATLENVRERLLLMSNRLSRVKRLAAECAAIVDPEAFRIGWKIRTGAFARLTRQCGHDYPLALAENAAVPPERLPEFLKAVQNVMKRHGVSAAYSAHAGVGILHARPLLDPFDPENRAKLPAISDDILEETLRLGGSFHAEHGCGPLRSGAIGRQFPRLQPVFRRIKTVLDPKGVLNPGRIVGVQSRFPVDSLRRRPDAAAANVKPQLQWSDTSIGEMAARCNGCGACRTTDVAVRMCPTFRVEQTEYASPRSKANLMRQILAGQLDPKTVSSDEFRRLADLCVNCKMCRVQCPSGVDISKLMLDAKAANVAEHGLSRIDAVFAALDDWSGRGVAFATLANGLLGSRTFRGFAEYVFGLSRQRSVPKFRSRTFLRRAARNGWTKKPRSSDPLPKVAFFFDTFVNHHDPQLGELAVRVLQRHGRRVYVPPRQTASGMIPLQYGDVESARARLQENLNILTDLARDGYDIVAIEPASAILFRDDAGNLLEGDDIELVASRTYEFGEFMGHLFASGQAKAEFSPLPVRVGYHEPCLVKALPPRAAVTDLLRTIPDFRVAEVDRGCSGMAGTFGMRADGYETSMQAGAATFERLSRLDVQFAMTQCSACRMQIEQAVGKRALHPAHLLAVAHGLVEEPNRLFGPPRKGLAV